MINTENTHFTKKQLEVLKKRKMGKSISEIAENMGTSKSNVSHILESAEKNIEKAENTLKIAKTINWPIKIEFEVGTNLFDISERIFEKANDEGVKLDFTGPDLLKTLAEKAGTKIKNRRIQTKISIVINREGKIE
ncbi:hypothetical protein AKJ37_07660, partial [candidate division MSBL1 archaeon SCGC-AAA259I09]